jgi:hypothetical protein
MTFPSKRTVNYFCATDCDSNVVEVAMVAQNLDFIPKLTMSDYEARSQVGFLAGRGAYWP